MLDVCIKTIPHAAQRYDTCGDYWTDENGMEQIRISDLGDRRYEFLVAVHELIEDFICQYRGIGQEDIRDFDEQILRDMPENNDPGSLPDAPYHKEHMFATAVEMLVAQQLDVCWPDYEQAFDCLRYIQGEP